MMILLKHFVNQVGWLYSCNLLHWGLLYNIDRHTRIHASSWTKLTWKEAEKKGNKSEEQTLWKIKFIDGLLSTPGTLETCLNYASKARE